MGKINEFDEFFVVVEEQFGRIYEPFSGREEAYKFMIEKLSEGKCASISHKSNLPKIHYNRRKELWHRQRKNG